MVLLVTLGVDLDDGLFPSAAIYCLRTREKAVWTADDTQTIPLHTANSRSSCSGLFKSRGDSKAGVLPPTGHKEHDNQHENRSPHNITLILALSPCKCIQQGREPAQYGILQCLEETGLSYAVLTKPTPYVWSSVCLPIFTLTMTLQNWYISDS